MRLLLAIVVALAVNAIALLIAAAVLGGFDVGTVTFPILVVIFTAVSMAVSFLVDSIVRRHAEAVKAFIGLISAFLSLLITDLIADSLTIDGAAAWIVGTLLFWLASLVFSPLLGRWRDRRLGRGRS